MSTVVVVPHVTSVPPTEQAAIDGALPSMSAPAATMAIAAKLPSKPALKAGKIRPPLDFAMDSEPVERPRTKLITQHPPHQPAKPQALYSIPLAHAF